MNKYKNTENLSHILRSARTDEGLTQIELAKKLRTKQPAISRVENGNITSIRFAEKWANACGYQLRFNHITIENEVGSLSSFTGENE